MGDYASCYLTEPLWNYFGFVFLVFAVNAFVGLFSIRHVYCCLRKPCYSLSFLVFLLLWCFMWVVLATAGFLVWFDYCGWYGYTWQLSLFVVLAALTPLWFWCMFWSNKRQAATFLAVILLILSITLTVVFFIIDLCAGASILLYTIWLVYIAWWSWRVSCLNRGMCYVVETTCRYNEALPTKHCCKEPYYTPIHPQQPSHHHHHRTGCVCPNPCAIHQTINSSRGGVTTAPSAVAVLPPLDHRKINV